MPSIAILGAGPKAAAIAAKAAVLNGTIGANIQIEIFERHSVGAAWSGSVGYTDGQQPLCTIAERDLGFPYSKTSYRPVTAAAMFSQFSWHSFAVRYGIDRANYESWVNHGRHPPLHSEFVEYLANSIRLSGAQIHNSTEVRQLDWTGSAWMVASQQTGAALQWNGPYDAVVVTGSGPAVHPLPVVPSGPRGPRVFDGITFWTNPALVQHVLNADHPDDREIVIIGAGGTAAAIAYYLLRNGIALPITIIGNEPTLYARHPGYFEDRLFTEEDDWKLLDEASRDAFVKRLTVGVVWDYVLRNLDSENIKYMCAGASHFERLSTRSASSSVDVDLVVHTHPPIPRGTTWSGPTHAIGASVFIDARGFNCWAFIDLLAPSLKALLPTIDDMKTYIDYNLSIQANPTNAPFPPGLHVPMAGARQGPGATNLMALGWLSDRVLQAYAPLLPPITVATGSP